MMKRAERVGRKKPWRIITAPLPRDWDEILSELNSPLGLELYMLGRQIRLFADCPIPRRDRLFGRRPRHVGERRSEALYYSPATLRRPLSLLMRLSAQQLPDELEIASACEEISVWAQEAGHSKTAVHYAELSASIRPHDPYFAFVAGRANRIMGIPWRAEVFYSRAIRYAYRQLNWDLYIRAHLGLGRLLADHGRLRVAALHYYSAARVAVDQGIDWLAAQTYHDLLVMHIEAGELATADVYARLALATYPLHNDRYPLAVHDYALLLISERHFADALSLLELVSAAAVPSHDQVIVWSTFARAAGSLGRSDQYSEAEAQVLKLAPHYQLFAPAAFVNLAFGARALSDWQLAETYAKRGIKLAESRGDHVVQSVGTDLLTEISNRMSAPLPAPPLTGEPAERLRDVLESAAKHLAAWHAETWTRKESQSGVMTLGPV
jgi:tetratricopeptide (TPR) repeat protein